MNSILKKNRVSLSKLNEYLIKRMDDTPDDPDINLVRGKNGDANISFKFLNRIELAYPNDLSPKSDAKMIAKKATLHKEDFSILIGAGAGHLLHEMLLAKENKHHILLIEPKVELIKIALSVYDFSKWIEDGTLLMLAPEKKEEIVQTFGMLEGLFVTQGWAIYTEKYAIKCYPEIYSKTIDDTMTMLNSMQCNIGTVSGAGAEIAKNDIMNLPYVIRHRGVNELKDLFRGKPCVSIATGPSLAKNIHLLKGIQDQVIIIAVAQALRLLLAHDIKPDFVTTVDFGKTNIEHFLGLMDCDVPLIALNRTYAEILKRYQGPKFIVGTPVPGFEDTSVGIISTKGSVEQGGSVAHMNLGVAMFMGCNPITLLGHDMGYEDITKSHVDGADASGKVYLDENKMLQWQVDDPRSHLHEDNREGKEAVYPMGGMYIDGYWGKPVMTNNGLQSFINSFEMIARANPKMQLYNSTEGGADIKEYKKILLSKFIEENCQDQIDKSVIKPLLSLCSDSDTLIDKVIPLVDSDVQLFKDIIENCEKAAETTVKMKAEKDVKEKQNLLKENAEYATKAQDLTKKNNLMGVAIYYASRAIYSRQFSIGETVFKSAKHAGKHLSKNEKDMAIAIARSELIIEAAKKAAEEFLKIHEDVAKLLKDYKETKNERLLIDATREEVSLGDADVYLSTGNWAHPLIDARRLLAINPLNKEAIRIMDLAEKLKKQADEKAREIQGDSEREKLLRYNFLMEEAHRSGKDKKDFDLALKLLDEAVLLFPDKYEARWGKATTLNHTGKIDEALSDYDKLLTDFPEHKITLQFEKSCVMIQKDVKEGLRLMGEVFSVTDQYDHMLALVGKLYGQSGMTEEAITAYKKYLEKYPADINVWKVIDGLYHEIGDVVNSRGAQKKIKELTA